MPPTDDALGLRLLGEVQELRAALERVNDRAEARALKAPLLSLHVASRGITVAPDVGKIVDEFFTTARDLIVKGYGTAAWDEPETAAEALARTAPLPPSPYNDPGQLLSDVELEAAEAVVRAAIRWTDPGRSTSPRPAAKVMSSFDLIMAELRRLRGKA